MSTNKRSPIEWLRSLVRPDACGSASARVLRWSIALVCAVSLLFRWLMLDQLPFIMDELVDTQLGVQVGAGLTLYRDLAWPRTPLLTFLIGLWVDPRDGSFATAVAARQLMWIGTLLIFGGVYFTARRALGRRVAPFAALLLATFSSFLDRSIRVRADLAATTLALPALFFLCAPTLTLPGMAAAGFFLGLAAIATQKAIYFVAAFAVALIARAILERRATRRPLRRFLLLSSVSAGCFFVPVAGLFAWAASAGCLQQLIDQSLRYARGIELASNVYGYTWSYLWQSISRNAAFWFLGISGVLILVVEAIRRSGADQPSAGTDTARRGARLALGLWTLVLLVSYLHHSVKFPYIFINLAPGLAVAGSLVLARLVLPCFEHTSVLHWRTLAVIVGTAYFFVFIPYRHHKRNLTQELTAFQRTLMDRVDELTGPDDAVLDGIGIAVARKKATPYSVTQQWVAERRAGIRHDVIGHIRSSRPRVYISNYRMHRLSKQEKDFLKSHFIQDWANVYVAGAEIEHRGKQATKKKIDLLATAEYAVVSKKEGEVRIDGKPAQPVQQLEAGRHTIEVSGARRTVQLELARAQARPPPPTQSKRSIFPTYSQ